MIPGSAAHLGGERRPISVGGVLLRLLAIAIAFAIVFAFTAILTVIYPGMMRWTAPIVCPGGFPDPFVVRDTYSVQPGETSTTFTMYCMDERGVVRDAGWFGPLLLLTVGVAALLVLLVAVGAIRRRLQAREAAVQVGAPDGEVVSGL
jgi:hypothetical protein